MVKQNEIYQVEIIASGNGAEGIAKVNGFTIFIPGGVEGDKAYVRITKVKSAYAFGEIETLLLPSVYRQESYCPVSQNCGGCQISHIQYPTQLLIKKQIVIDCLERIGKLDLSDTKVFDTLGMENPLRYRNKMVFPIGTDDNGNIIGGFYAPKSHQIVPLTNCFLGDEAATKYMKTVVEFMKLNGIIPYDEVKHKGVIRRVFVRLGYHSKEAMVVISINGKNLKNKEQLIEMLLAVPSPTYRLKSIILNINSHRNNLVLGNKNITLYGSDTISDTLCGLHFKISPNSFYQVNPLQTELLYNTALSYADLKGTETVIDLYSGIGTISLCCAKKAKKVIGVEIVPQAVKDAEQNALENGIYNVDFYAKSADEMSIHLQKSGNTPDVIMIDPPRKGSDNQTLNAILKMNPQKIVYISCNPSTLARDLKLLHEGGYMLTKVQPVDMFPNTSHVEAVVLMSRVEK